MTVRSLRDHTQRRRSTAELSYLVASYVHRAARGVPDDPSKNPEPFAVLQASLVAPSLSGKEIENLNER